MRALVPGLGRPRRCHGEGNSGEGGEDGKTQSQLTRFGVHGDVLETLCLVCTGGS